MAAGRHLTDLRRALSEATRQPVDYLFTDLLIYWAGQQEMLGAQPDSWAERIARWRREQLPPERIRARLEGEARARSLLENKVGQFAEADLRQFLTDLSADWWKEKPRVDRFMPALYGAQVNRMAETLDAFNSWVERIWRADEAELDDLLDEFWARLEVSGAGVSLPTAILYLRDPEQYNIWLPVMSKGLKIAAGFEPGKWRTARAYRRYNAALNDFREQYQLAPQALDAILWQIARSGKIEDDEIGGRELEDVYTLKQLCDETFLEADFWEEVKVLMHDKKQIVFYGPPGTGKTWVACRFARYWVDAATDPAGDVQVIQFHPSYAYEEFVEGIRPQSVEGPDGRRELSYPVKKGLFRRFCDQARTHPQRRYALILDEINRGELPRILGELLYLLEYRHESVMLPYSGDPFAIPANLYLIGTMNTADRSIALVDHALRRRFHFVQMRPSSDILRAYFENTGDPEMIWTADLLDLLSSQLEQDGIEWHLHIGHSHFMRRDLDETQLRLIWKHSVIPTLEEYFYRQPDRLRSYQLSMLKAALGKA